MSTELPSAAGQAPQVRFVGSPAFQTTLRQVVDRYFRITGISTRDSLRMYVKTAIVATWTMGVLRSLVFVADAWWQTVPLAISTRDSRRPPSASTSSTTGATAPTRASPG